MPTILGGKLPGKIGLRRHNRDRRDIPIGHCQIEYALIAQSVEHAAVNRGVTGSSPVWGAKQKTTHAGGFLLYTKTTRLTRGSVRIK